jgi:uncharacterized protein (TIGR00255 family)
MTGFGVGAVAVAEGRVVAEIRSVNQRYLDVRARLPRELADLALFAEQIVRERLRRGRVELVVHTEGAVVAPPVLDKARAREAFRALGELRDELAPGAEVPLSLLGSVPDLFAPPPCAQIERLRDAVKASVEQAVAAMAAMCLREGEALAADLRARCEHLRRLTAEIEGRSGEAQKETRRRLRDRVARLLAGGDYAAEAARIETEIVLVADRSDITEEVTRLGSHLDQLHDALGEGGAEPVGRRLDFLLQEMLREANTIAAKGQDAAVSHHVVAMKVELERIREQVQNLE